MKLIMVSYINDLTNLNEKLSVQSILKKDFGSRYKVYKEFRKIVPKGRYALAMTEDDIELFVIDTNVIEKMNN